MDSQSRKQIARPFTSRNRPYAPTTCPSSTIQTEHTIPLKRPEKLTTTSIPAKPNHISNAPKSAPMQVYLLSDEATDRRVKSAGPGRPHQTPNPRTKPGHEVDINEDTKALEEWMAEVTAHPERAMELKDFDQVLPSTAQLYEALPSDEGGDGQNGQPPSIISQESMQPVLFCFCCPPDPTARRL